MIRLVQQTGTQRNKRGAPLEFVSSAAKGLFGFAKHADVIEIEENLFNLQRSMNHSLGGIRRNHKLMQSAVKINNKRINSAHENIRESQRRINKIVTDMHELTDFVNQQVQSSLRASEITHNIIKFQSQLTASVMRRVVSQITFLQGLRNHLQVYLAGLQTLIEGYLPISLVTPEQVSNILGHVEYELMRTHPEFEVAVSDVEYYYKQNCELVVVKNNFIVTLLVPLATSASTFQLYKTHAIKVPVSVTGGEKLSYSYTKITDVAEYFAISDDGYFYLELNSFELSHCLGHDNYRVCYPFMVQVDRSKMSCTSALYDDRPDDVTKFCKVTYDEQEQPQTDLVSIGKGKVLISSPQQEWTMVCSKMAPRMVKQCHFCIIELECSFSLRSKHYLIPPLLENCDDIQSTRAVHYPVNYIAASAVMTENDNLNVTGTTLFGSTPTLPMPQIDIKSTTMESVATSDTELAVDFNKVMNKIARNENIYLTKADPMASMKNSVQKFIESDYSESTGGILVVYVTATVIAVTYLYYRLHMLTVMLAMLKLPVADAINPATADGSHTDGKLGTNCSPSEIVVVALLVFAVAAIGLVLWNTIKICYYKIVVHRMITTQQFTCDQIKQHLYVHIYTATRSITLYMGTINANLINCKISKPLSETTLAIRGNRRGIHSYLRINWKGAKLILDGSNAINLPNIVAIPLDKYNQVNQIIINKRYNLKVIAGSSNIFLPMPVREDQSIGDHVNKV